MHNKFYLVVGVSALALFSSAHAPFNLNTPISHIGRFIASVELPHLEKFKESHKDLKAAEIELKTENPLDLKAKVEKLEPMLKDEVAKIDGFAKAIDKIKINDDFIKGDELDKKRAELISHVGRLLGFEKLTGDLKSSIKDESIKMDKNETQLEELQLSLDNACRVLDRIESTVAQEKKNKELEQKLAELEKKLNANTEKEAVQQQVIVCKVKETSVLTGQIEELNKQQQQLTQTIIGLNQVMLGMRQPQLLGMNYFADAYRPNPYFMNQYPGMFPGSQMAYNPFGPQPMTQQPYYQQQQPPMDYFMNPYAQQSSQVINNYYQVPYNSPFSPQNLQQAPGMMPGFQAFNFDVPGMTDGSRAVFGNFKS